MFCYVYIKKQEKQRDVLIKALDVFLICPVVFKKGADVLKFMRFPAEGFFPG